MRRGMLLSLAAALVAAWACAAQALEEQKERPVRPDGPPMAARLDANKDGKVTLDEIPEGAPEQVKEMLRKADTDGDGVLTSDELRQAMPRFGRGPFGFGPPPAGGRPEADRPRGEGPQRDRGENSRDERARPRDRGEGPRNGDRERDERARSRDRGDRDDGWRDGDRPRSEGHEKFAERRGGERGWPEWGRRPRPWGGGPQGWWHGGRRWYQPGPWAFGGRPAWGPDFRPHLRRGADMRRPGMPGFGRPDPKEMFKRLDRNQDGSLSPEEFAAIGRVLPRPPMPPGPRMGFRGPLPDRAAAMRGMFEKGKELFGRVDANKDGKIEASEVPSEHRERFEKLLEKADKDGDKAVSGDEAKQAVGAFMERVRKAAAERIRGERGGRAERDVRDRPKDVKRGDRLAEEKKKPAEAKPEQNEKKAAEEK